MERRFYDTIIISDLHLGSEASRAQDAVRMLKRHSFRRLILLGDIFCDLNFARLTKEHWRFLSYIRKLSNPRRNIEIIWVEGNHDQGLSHVMAHLVGVRVYKQYEWDFASERHLAIHGHQFDRFLVDSALFSKLGHSIYLALQKVESGATRLTRYLDWLNTLWLRLSPKVAAGALAYARQRHASRVFCGHTHLPMQAERDGVSYYNSGCWIHTTATYITINEQGVLIHDYDQPTDHRHSGEERGQADAELAELFSESGLPVDVVHESVYS